MAIDEQKLFKWKEKKKIGKIIDALEDDSVKISAENILIQMREESIEALAKKYFSKKEHVRENCHKIFIKMDSSLYDAILMFLVLESVKVKFSEIFNGSDNLAKEKKDRIKSLAAELQGEPGAGICDQYLNFVKPLQVLKEMKRGLNSVYTGVKKVKLKNLGIEVYTLPVDRIGQYQELMLNVLELYIYLKANQTIIEQLIVVHDFIFAATTAYVGNYADKFLSDVDGVENNIETIKTDIDGRNKFYKNKILNAYPDISFKEWKKSEFTVETTYTENMTSTETTAVFTPGPDRAIELYRELTDKFDEERFEVSV